jgi:ABC-type Mn2+/Zn2+ transport system permease subunit
MSLATSVLSHLSLYQRAAVEVVVAGFAAGVIGVHVVLRRLEFLAVALTHATFPGVVLAYWLGFLPLIGALGFGWLVVGILVVLTRLAAVDTSAIVGVVLAGSLGLGVLLQGLQPRPTIDLAALLTGHIATASNADVLTSLIVAVIVLVVLAALHKELVFASFDPQAARAQGYGRWLDVVLALALEAVVITTLPATGTVLAIALLIVPAMTARLWSDRIGTTFLLAGVIGSASGAIGLTVADRLGSAAGATIALVTGVGFLLSWLLAPHGLRATHIQRAMPTSAGLG